MGKEIAVWIETMGYDWSGTQDSDIRDTLAAGLNYIELLDGMVEVDGK